MSTEAWSEAGLSGRRLVTEHFHIISTLGDAEFEAALPRYLEAAYARYQEVLPIVGKPAGELTTYVFGTRSEWVRFARRRFPARFDVYSRITSGGFTEGSTAVLFYVSRSGTLAALAHEGWHQYVGSRVKAPVPAWLNEGLACYHEAVEFSGPEPKFTPRHNTFRINALREAVQTDELISLRGVVDTDAGRIIGGYDSRKADAYYAQAWALVTFLRHGAGGRYAEPFKEMLGNIADGTFGIRVSAARLNTNDGGSLTTGEAAFRAYFECPPGEMEHEYFDHLIRVAGF